MGIKSISGTPITPCDRDAALVTLSRVKHRPGMRTIEDGEVIGPEQALYLMQALEAENFKIVRYHDSFKHALNEVARQGDGTGTFNQPDWKPKK